VGRPLSLVPSVRFDDPLNDPALAGFTTGGASAYEREVDEIVKAFYDGHQPDQLQFLIAEAPGATVCVCAIHERPLQGVDPGAMYVGVIGVAAAFRGCYLPTGESLGDFMLTRSLAELFARWTVMPTVWALIDIANTRSQALFSRHAFAHLRTDKYQLWVRPAGLAV